MINIKLKYSPLPVMQSKKLIVPPLNLCSLNNSNTVGDITEREFKEDPDATMCKIKQTLKQIKQRWEELRQNKLFDLETLEYTAIRYDYDQLHYKFLQANKYLLPQIDKLKFQLHQFNQIKNQIKDLNNNESLLSQLELQIKQTTIFYNLKQQNKTAEILQILKIEFNDKLSKLRQVRK